MSATVLIHHIGLTAFLIIRILIDALPLYDIICKRSISFANITFGQQIGFAQYSILYGRIYAFHFRL